MGFLALVSMLAAVPGSAVASPTPARPMPHWTRCHGTVHRRENAFLSDGIAVRGLSCRAGVDDVRRFPDALIGVAWPHEVGGYRCRSTGEGPQSIKTVCVRRSSAYRFSSAAD